MKKQLRIPFLAVSILILSGAARAASDSKQEAIQTKVESSAPISSVSVELRESIAGKLRKLITSSSFKDKQIGIWVGTNTDQGLESLYDQNGSRPFIPASLSKIVTAGAVLKTLHPTYKYKTLLVSDARIKDGGVLAGSLYLRGGGDPSFVSENMWLLVNELTRSGIISIDGDIVIDDTRFDDIRIGQDRESVRSDRAYDAPIGAMSMNWNSVNVYIRPGAKAGEPLRVFLDPDTSYLRLLNETKTVAAGRGKNIEISRVKQKGFFGEVIRVTGRMAVDAPEAVVYKSISEPDLWSGHNLVTFLKQRGITVRGQVRRGIAPAQARILATYESKPLSLIVADMAKWSNNYVAEMLVKGLAAESGVVPATMTAGMKKIDEFLRQNGFKSDEYKFINASGFSRENKLTPLQIGRILELMRADFTAFPEFLTALPIGGVDGTLRNRMKNSAAERWVRAKTGLLNGVVGLAGYAGHADGTVRTFVFIYNGSGREDQARSLFDRLAAALVGD